MFRLLLSVPVLALGVDLAIAQVPGVTVLLPPPDRAGKVPLESLLSGRHSTREFAERPLDLPTVSQLLWAVGGVNRPDGQRTVPSAGALYPLEVYLVAGDVSGLEAGVYRYDPRAHTLVRTVEGDVRARLATAAVRQRWIASVPVVLVVAAEYERTTGKYGDRGVRYAHIEVGAVAQSVYLQAGALGLGTTLVGAFDDAEVAKVLGLPSAHRPLGLLPVGSPVPR